MIKCKLLLGEDRLTHHSHGTSKLHPSELFQAICTGCSSCLDSFNVTCSGQHSAVFSAQDQGAKQINKINHFLLFVVITRNPHGWKSLAQLQNLRRIHLQLSMWNHEGFRVTSSKLHCCRDWHALWHFMINRHIPGTTNWKPTPVLLIFSPHNSKSSSCHTVTHSSCGLIQPICLLSLNNSVSRQTEPSFRGEYIRDWTWKSEKTESVWAWTWKSRETYSNDCSANQDAGNPATNQTDRMPCSNGERGQISGKIKLLWMQKMVIVMAVGNLLNCKALWTREKKVWSRTRSRKRTDNILWGMDQSIPQQLDSDSNSAITYIAKTISLRLHTSPNSTQTRKYWTIRPVLEHILSLANFVSLSFSRSFFHFLCKFCILCITNKNISSSIITLQQIGFKNQGRERIPLPVCHCEEEHRGSGARRPPSCSRGQEGIA